MITSVKALIKQAYSIYQIPSKLRNAIDIKHTYINDFKYAIEFFTAESVDIDVKIYREALIIFIKNCSSIHYSYGEADLVRPDIAMDLLAKKTKILGEDITRDLAIELIKNCISAPSYWINFSRPTNVQIAKQCLFKFHPLINIDIHNRLILELIKSALELNSDTALGVALDDQIDLLNFYKEFLNKEDPQLYTQAVTKVFNQVIFLINYSFGDRIYDYLTIFMRKLLDINGEAVSSELLIDTYRNTQSYFVFSAIRRYVQGSGAYRQINLPERRDIFITGRAPDSIAFQVHKYMSDIEKLVLHVIKQYLDLQNIDIQDYTIEELQNKLTLIDNLEFKEKALQALGNINNEENYQSLLVEALPIITSLLNFNDDLWEADYETLNSRWNMWLTQSFIEAGYAYDGDNSISCIRGIYERLFSGFRTMHPVIDALFITRNITIAIDKNIKNVLIEYKDDIVKLLLKEELVEISELDIKNKYKLYLKDLVYNQINEQVGLTINKLYLEKLTLFKTKLEQYCYKLRDAQLPAALDKYFNAIESIEDIEIGAGYNLIQYIQDKYNELKI